MIYVIYFGFILIPTNPAKLDWRALRSDALTLAPTKFDTPETDALFLFNTCSHLF